MKTRKNRRHVDVQKRETNFFSKRDGKPHFEAEVNEAFFRPRLIIGQSRDRFEQEADRAADHVVNRALYGSNDVNAVRRKAGVRRQAAGKGEPVEAGAEEKKEPVEAQAEEKDEPVEAQADEKEEPLEANAEEEEEPVEAKEEEEEEPVEAQAEEKDEETRANPAIQRKSEETRTRIQANPEGRPDNPNFTTRLRQQLGKGRPLPDKVRSEMESALDADFSSVRIHTDEEAAQLSNMLKAQAFTRGDDIFFAQGKFDPETRAGKHLLAHELAHTKQQKDR